MENRFTKMDLRKEKFTGHHTEEWVERSTKEEDWKCIVICYCSSVFGKTGRLLGKAGIQMIHHPAPKIAQMVRPVKDRFRVPGV